MEQEKIKILNLFKEGKLTAEEALELMSALEETETKINKTAGNTEHSSTQTKGQEEPKHHKNLLHDLHFTIPNFTIPDIKFDSNDIKIKMGKLDNIFQHEKEKMKEHIKAGKEIWKEKMNRHGREEHRHIFHMKPNPEETTATSHSKNADVHAQIDEKFVELLDRKLIDPALAINFVSHLNGCVNEDIQSRILDLLLANKLDAVTAVELLNALGDPSKEDVEMEILELIGKDKIGGGSAAGLIHALKGPEFEDVQMQILELIGKDKIDSGTAAELIHALKGPEFEDIQMQILELVEKGKLDGRIAASMMAQFVKIEKEDMYIMIIKLIEKGTMNGTAACELLGQLNANTNSELP